MSELDELNTEVSGMVWFEVATLDAEVAHDFEPNHVTLYGCPRCGAVVFERAVRTRGYDREVRYGRNMHALWHEQQVV